MHNKATKSLISLKKIITELINKKAFSMAETTIALLIGSIILGITAPVITKQIKNQSLTDTQLQIVQKQINELNKKTINIESGAVMFFRRTSCPDGWSIIKNKGGYYLRIAQVNDEGKIIESKNIGDTIEAMVHKHKHVSPVMAYYGSTQMNQLRYGPYFLPGTKYLSTFKKNVQGDYSYPEPPNMYTTGIPTSYSNNAYTFYGVTYPSAYHFSTFTYTNDGMNREEALFGIKDNGSMDIKPITVCPNRDEGDIICKPSGNNYNIPYLSAMPLVGNENRPKSILLIACEKD